MGVGVGEGDGEGVGVCDGDIAGDGVAAAPAEGEGVAWEFEGGLLAFEIVFEFEFVLAVVVLAFVLVVVAFVFVEVAAVFVFCDAVWPCALGDEVGEGEGVGEGNDAQSAVLFPLPGVKIAGKNRPDMTLPANIR